MDEIHIKLNGEISELRHNGVEHIIRTDDLSMAIEHIISYGEVLSLDRPDIEDDFDYIRGI